MTEEQIIAAKAYLLPFFALAVKEGLTDEEAIGERVLELARGEQAFTVELLSCPRKNAAFKRMMAPIVWADFNREAAVERATAGAEALIKEMAAR